jgi:SAM-dependent methyltransferase
MDLRTTIRVLRSGDVRARLAAVRDGRAALRLATTAAAIDSGVLTELDGGALTGEELAERVGATALPLMAAFLEVLVVSGLATRHEARFSLTRRGRAALRDEVARATYTAFSDFHTGLYRDLPGQLRGGPGRDDVTRQAAVIAELSQVMQPFTDALLREVIGKRRPASVLDVGCGSGRQLATMLEAARGAVGTGIELDPAASDLARVHLAERGLADRAEVLTGDARELVPSLPERVDLALLANVVYYVPVDERVDLFGTLLDALRPGGVLVVVSTALLDDPFSRHFDLLLRAQEGRMELPDLERLTAQLADAGFVPGAPRRIAHGEPLHAVVATRP